MHFLKANLFTATKETGRILLENSFLRRLDTTHYLLFTGEIIACRRKAKETGFLVETSILMQFSSIQLFIFSLVYLYTLISGLLSIGLSR